MYSIKHYVRILLFISFITLALDLIVSFASIVLVRQQSARYLQDTADLYIDRIDNNFAYIHHFMGWTLANDEDMETMSESGTSDPLFLKANQNLYKRFAELQKSHGREYNFFVYLRDKDFLLNTAPMRIDYSQFEALKRTFTANIRKGDLYEKFYSRWTTIELNGMHYIINIVPYHDRYLICLVSADDLILPLRELNLGGGGFASIVNESGIRVTSPVSNSGEAIEHERQPKSFLDRLQSGTTVIRDFSDASFSIELVIRFGAFEKTMVAQLLVVILAVFIACSLCVIMLYFQKRVLAPIKHFSNNLTVLTSNGEPIDFENNKIIELEKANRQFVDLMKQIKAFKIDLYERELEKQNMQLNYMKLQIKPHFFLNCLTTIYSMAQMHMHAEIERMTLSISNYFRYLFQNERDCVSLLEEIEHIRTYLDIQRERYRHAFQYRIDLDAGAAGASLPPLLLTTFIENAVKYAVSGDRDVMVALDVKRRTEDDVPMTEIRISDNGPGFPTEVLDQLAAGQPLDQSGGTRIGIMNAVQRLRYLYRDADIRFSNLPGSGACITLLLPDRPEERHEWGGQP
jgi:two-component system, sensor histidine kinase YesM